jgi:hypothetical protein
MSFAAPAFLYALGLIVPVLIAFLVRRRRRVLRVPSTTVWRLGTGTVVKNRRIRDLRRILALVACLLGVAALAVAAARPSGRRVDTTIYVVDVSASMSGTPIRDARRWLTRDTATLGQYGRVAIILAGLEPKVVVPLSPPGPAVDAAIRAIEARPEPSAVEPALAIAESLSGSARIVVLSDHAVDAESRRTDFKPTARIFAPSSKDNVGIHTFYSRAALESGDEDAREATIAIGTSSEVPRRVSFKVTHSGATVTERRLEIPPHSEIQERVGLRGGGRVVARVEPLDGRADAIALDDQASLDEPERKAPRVALVGPTADDLGAFFIEKALHAANVSAIKRVAPTEEAPRDVDLAVVLKDGPGRPTDVPAFFVVAEPPGLGLDLRRVAKDQTRLRSLTADDPLLRGVALDDFTTLGATVATAPQGARVLVDLDGGPVLLAGGAAQHSWVWLGIDPAESDLVLKVAFPVLVGNVLSQLGGVVQTVSANTVPRAEVMLSTTDAVTPLAGATDPRWRIPASPPVLLAGLGALLLALEAWLTFRKRWVS